LCTIVKQKKRIKINDKVSVFLEDAINLDQWHKKYDLIIITWFTAGNFYHTFNFETYNSTNEDSIYQVKKFDTIFQIYINC
jgi:hypothetical protein